MHNRIFRLFAGLAVAACATVSLAGAARADNVVYVSIKGSDSNNCLPGSPCRSLQAGINKAPAGGEVRFLDSGYFGAATINKTITIAGDGNTLNPAGTITINSATAVVKLRDLVLDGAASSAHGITVTAAAAVHIEHCVIEHFTDDGVNANGATTKLFMSDSIARENGATGLFVSASGAAQVAMSRVSSSPVGTR